MQVNFNVVDISDCSCSGHKQVVSSDRHFGQGTEHHNWLGIRLTPFCIEILKQMFIIPVKKMQNTCSSIRKKHLKMSTANMSYRLYTCTYKRKSRSTPFSSHSDKQFCKVSKVFLKAGCCCECHTT